MPELLHTEKHHTEKTGHNRFIVFPSGRFVCSFCGEEVEEEE
jgi:hypothetical protein